MVLSWRKRFVVRVLRQVIQGEKVRLVFSSLYQVELSDKCIRLGVWLILLEFAYHAQGSGFHPRSQHCKTPQH